MVEPVTAAGLQAPWQVWLKAAICALLFCNTAFYVATGSPSEALDATAWLVLLALFLAETAVGARLRAGGARMAVRGARFAAALTIAAAAVGYVNDQAWLDVVNTVLWIAVVVLLEIELRRGAIVARHRIRFAIAAAALYAGIAALVPIWAWRGEWFDAYDALLWLAAFATIEMDVLRTARGNRSLAA